MKSIWRFCLHESGLDPVPHSSNFLDPDPHTINLVPHHWKKRERQRQAKTEKLNPYRSFHDNNRNDTEGYPGVSLIRKREGDIQTERVREIERERERKRGTQGEPLPCIS